MTRASLAAEYSDPFCIAYRGLADGGTTERSLDGRSLIAACERAAALTLLSGTQENDLHLPPYLQRTVGTFDLESPTARSGAMPAGWHL